MQIAIIIALVLIAGWLASVEIRRHGWAGLLAAARDDARAAFAGLARLVKR